MSYADMAFTEVLIKKLNVIKLNVTKYNYLKLLEDILMKKLTLIGAAFSLALSSTASFAYNDVTTYEAYDLATSDPDTMILDVRTRYEWGFVGHPTGEALEGKVVNISVMVVNGEELSPNPYFIEDVKKILADNPNMKFITMCRSGSRSKVAAEMLDAAGIPASNMLKGFEGGKDAFGYRTVNGWKNSNLPYAAACDGNGYERYKYYLNPKGLMIPAQATH